MTEESNGLEDWYEKEWPKVWYEKSFEHKNQSITSSINIAYLINGGAAVALITFMSRIWHMELLIGLFILISLFLHGVGIICAALAERSRKKAIDCYRKARSDSDEEGKRHSRMVDAMGNASHFVFGGSVIFLFITASVLYIAAPRAKIGQHVYEVVCLENICQKEKVQDVNANGSNPAVTKTSESTPLKNNQ